MDARPTVFSTIAKGQFTVMNSKGLHTRPATELVKCSLRFRSEIHLRYKDRRASGKSVLNILILAAGKGAQVTVEAEGPDAEEAVAAILALASEKFLIDY